MSFIAPFDGFNTVVNVLMATGPILVPPAVAAAGLGLGSIILLMMAVISAITASYVIECLSACNMIETLTESDELPLLNMKQDSMQEITIAQVDMEKTFEIGEMGKISYGRWGEMFNTIVMVAYLYGIIITKGIIVGNTISGLFANTPVMNSFYFWISMFYLVCGLLSFKDVAHIAIVQSIIGAIRYLTIYTMIMGAAQTISFDKNTDIPIEPIAEFDIYKFSNLFSSVVLGFMNHHSIPSMLRPIRPSSEIIKITIIPFVFALIVYILICSSGMFAFPYLSMFCQYNIAFDVPLTSVSYYVVSFYIFLNISGVPVQAIVARKNMIQLCAPSAASNDYMQITWTSAAFTLMVLMPCYIIAVALRNSIHLVIGITGGICGVLLLMVIPSFMVIHFRTRVSNNRFISFIANDTVAYAIGILGLVFALYNCYVAVMNIIKGSSCFEKPYSIRIMVQLIMNKINSYNAFNTLINVFMGTGPLVIPPAIGQVGFLLGVIVLFIFAVISAITAEYVIECLGACNKESDSDEITYIFEYSQMGKKLWGRKGEVMNTIAICLYLFGTITTKGIIVGHSLTSLFVQVPILNSYFFWVIVFYFISGILSFKDISHIAIIQTLIAIVRYLTITVMILASFIVIKENHQLVTPKEWDMSHISNLFGTAVLAYMMHHSLPSVLGPCPSTKIQGIIYSCFLMGYLILVVVSLTGMMTFQNLQQYCFYNVAFNRDPVIWAYYIISFYIFLNISGVPVLAIVTRKTIMKTLDPELMTESQFDLTFQSGSITFMILFCCCAIAIYLRDHIELVIAITGGICGIIIMLLLPSVMVLKFRRRIQNNYFKSYFTSNYIAYGIVIISILCINYNVYIQIDKYLNPQTLCSTH